MVAKWQRKLGLTEWDITAEAIPAKRIDAEGDLGDCWSDISTLAATIRVATAEHSAAEVETTVAHEVLHVLLAELTYAGNNAAECLGGDAKALAGRAIDTANERTVRRLEKLLCPPEATDET